MSYNCNKFIINFRKKINQNYFLGLKKFQDIFRFFKYDIKNKPCYHLSLLSINFKKIRSNKEKFISFLKKNKILCQYHYPPIYKFKIYDKKINKKYFRGSEYYFENSVSLPIFYNLKLSIQKKIINKIILFIKSAWLLQ